MPFCAATPSNAPAFTSASTTLRFTLRPSTRLQKSNSVRNGPPCSRATLTTSTAPSPTPLTAPRPKRITFLAAAVLAHVLTTEKSVSDSLTSGRSTAMPFAFASAMNFTTASVSSLSQVSSAAKNSTGK